MIKALILDWGGVLGEDNNRAAARILAEKYCLDKDALRKDFSESEDEYYTVKDNDEFYKRMYDKYGIPSYELKKELNNVPAWNDNFGFIVSLKSRGLKLCILSNQMQLRTEAIRKDNDLSVFDEAFFSSEVGFKKPQMEFFEFVLKRTGLKAIECVFVDDQVINVKAARTLGMNAIQYKNFEQFKKEIFKLIEG